MAAAAFIWAVEFLDRFRKDPKIRVDRGRDNLLHLWAHRLLHRHRMSWHLAGSRRASLGAGVHYRERQGLQVPRLFFASLRFSYSVVLSWSLWSAKRLHQDRFRQPPGTTRCAACGRPAVHALRVATPPHPPSPKPLYWQGSLLFCVAGIPIRSPRRRWTTAFPGW